MPDADPLLERAYLLWPLLAAALYALGAIAIKAASGTPQRARRAIVVSTAAMAAGFLPFYDWAAFPAIPDPWWPALAMGGLFAWGQAMTVFALSKGDVSIVTPVLGVKVILVGVIVALALGQPMGPARWVAVCCAAVGIAVLQWDDGPVSWRRNLVPVAIALLAASGFAVFDTMIQAWAPRVGFGRLLPPAMAFATLLSLPLLIGTNGESSHVGSRPAGRGRRTWLYLLAGSALLSLQGVVFMRSIAAYGDAAGANVAYASRGLWGVALVWAIGHRVGNAELQARRPRVVAARLAGAALVMAAIVLEFV